jgi:hypothetical protein
MSSFISWQKKYPYAIVFPVFGNTGQVLPESYENQFTHIYIYIFYLFIEYSLNLSKLCKYQ